MLAGRDTPRWLGPLSTIECICQSVCFSLSSCRSKHWDKDLNHLIYLGNEPSKGKVGQIRKASPLTCMLLAVGDPQDRPAQNNPVSPKERGKGCFWVTKIQVPPACPVWGLRLFTWTETWKQKGTGEWGRQQLWGRVRSWYPKAPFNCNFVLSKVIQNVFIEFLYQAYRSAGRWFYKCDCNSTLVPETGKWKWIILLIFT